MRIPKSAPAADVQQPQAPAPASLASASESKQDKLEKRLREEQAQRKAAEQRADELAKQLTTATMEIMRLKAEVYDLQHGLA